MVVGDRHQKATADRADSAWNRAGAAGRRRTGQSRREAGVVGKGVA
jgi:hypothetical protein